MKKLSEISIEKFTEILQGIEDINKLMETTKDAHRVVAEVYSKNQKISVVGAVNIIKRGLITNAQLENAKEYVGLLIGMRAPFKPNVPIQVAVLDVEGTGKHKEINMGYSPKVKTISGEQVQLVPPMIVKVKLLQNTEYKSKFILSQLVASKPANPDDILKILENDIKILPLSRVPEVPHPPGAYPVVVFKCKIRNILPTNIFKEDAKSPVWNDGVPTLKIQTETDDRVNAYINLDIPRVTEKNIPIAPAFIMSEDLIAIAEEAISRDETPEGQAELVSGVMAGREIIVVASIGSISESKTQWIDYTVNASAMALFEIPSEMKIDATAADDRVDGDLSQVKLDTEEKEEKKETVEEQPKKKSEKKKDKEKEKKIRWTEDQETPQEPEILDELKLLADTMGYETVGELTSNIEQLSKGKNLKEYDSDVVKAVLEKHATDKVT
jgi:uncharacterized membrane protein